MASCPSSPAVVRILRETGPAAASMPGMFWAGWGIGDMDRILRDLVDPVMARSGLLQADLLQEVGHVLAPIGGGLHRLVDLLPLDDFDGRGLSQEEASDRGSRHFI